MKERKSKKIVKSKESEEREITTMKEQNHGEARSLGEERS